MTVDEKVEAYRMLLNGSTYQEVMVIGTGGLFAFMFATI